MAWCEENSIDFVFALPGNAILVGAVGEAADDIRTRRAQGSVREQSQACLPKWQRSQQNLLSMQNC
jgi:hypothetical protein